MGPRLGPGEFVLCLYLYGGALQNLLGALEDSHGEGTWPFTKSLPWVLSCEVYAIESVSLFTLCYVITTDSPIISWWHHQMETFSALLAICAGNSPVSGEFPTQRPVTRSFDVFFDLRLNKRLSKQSWGWWLETLSPPLWRHRNVKSVGISASTSSNQINMKSILINWPNINSNTDIHFKFSANAFGLRM